VSESGATVGDWIKVLKNNIIIIMLKGTVQRKLTGVLSGINRQLMISQSVTWYFFKFKEPLPFKFK
jgi:hypothetical protein